MSAGLVVALAIAGAAAGLAFPKFQAAALLQFPEERKQEQTRLRDQKGVKNDEKYDEEYDDNVVRLPFYKRVIASYNSPAQLAAYLDATKGRDSIAAKGLLRQSETQSYWDNAVTPVLPFGRSDARQFGDPKNTADTSLLGLELRTSAGTAPEAVEMVKILAGYLTNSVIRERVRSWVLAGKVESLATEKTARADIARAELGIGLNRDRVHDMQAILSRYPEARRLDARQLVSVSPVEGDERFLSPLAQLVGAESMISQLRGRIRRLERDLRQRELLSPFYLAADSMVDHQPDVDKLLAALDQLARQKFSKVDLNEEWAKEATLRVGGALEKFSVMRSQFGIRTDVRVDAVRSRDPLRLAMFGAGAGVLLLGALAFLRASIRDTPIWEANEPPPQKGDKR